MKQSSFGLNFTNVSTRPFSVINIVNEAAPRSDEVKLVDPVKHMD